MTDVNKILNKADSQVSEWRNHMRDAANAFHGREGELLERADAISFIEQELDIDTSIAQDVVSNLVSDTIDPVIQIPYNGERYVGVVEYKEFDGAYGYIDFDDTYGKRRRVICAQCVHDEDHEHHVTHATAGDPAPESSFSDNPDASYEELVAAIHRHYEIVHHGITPSEVKTGASLASPTTIGGNTSWHAGNDGSGSGLDADKLDGKQPVDLVGPEKLTAVTENTPVSVPSGEVWEVSVYLADMTGNTPVLSINGINIGYARASNPRESIEFHRIVLTGGSSINTDADAALVSGWKVDANNAVEQTLSIGDSFTVPSDETWDATIAVGGDQDQANFKINGAEAFVGDNIPGYNVHGQVVLTGGTSIVDNGTGLGGMHISGYDVS